MEKLLTIVVPAYNAEGYLDRCLSSLLVPEIIGKVEVLIVNDGSTDSTLEIARGYELKHPNFFYVINKDNGNYGSVMNVSLKVSKGKYFKTLDSDDWYDKNALIQYVSELNETDADIIMNNYVRHQEIDNTETKYVVNDSVENSKDITITKDVWTSNIISNFNIHSVCYKTELLRKSGLIWPEKVFYSDIQTLFWPQRLCKTIRFIPVSLYVYLEGRTEQSMSAISKKRNFHSFDIVANNMLDEYLRVFEPKHPMAEVQKSKLVYILTQFYSYLYIADFRNFKSVIFLDKKLKKVPDLYHLFGKNNHFLSSLRKGRYSLSFICMRIKIHIFSLKRKIVNNYTCC